MIKFKKINIKDVRDFPSEVSKGFEKYFNGIKSYQEETKKKSIEEKEKSYQLKIGDYVFDYYTGTIIRYIGNEKDVVIPSHLEVKGIEYPVKCIGSFSFNNKGIESVIIPEGVTRIEVEAFSCNNLSEIVFPDSIRYLLHYSFASNKLTSVIIPNGILKIYTGAFDDNVLASVFIPESISSDIYNSYTFKDNGPDRNSKPLNHERISDAAGQWEIRGINWVQTEKVTTKNPFSFL